jgi:hypothetical protein
MATHNLDRGTTYTIGVAVKRNGSPQSLVGATVQFTMKPVESDQVSNDSSATVKKDVTSHVNAAGGISSVSIAPVDTALSPPGVYFYSIHVVLDSGERFKLEEGKVKLDGAPGNRL